MPNYREPVSPIDPVVLGTGGVVGANRSLPQNMECSAFLLMKYAGTTPHGKAPGHNPAYGSVGNDGHWPGKRR